MVTDQAGQERVGSSGGLAGFGEFDILPQTQLSVFFRDPLGSFKG